MFGFLKKKNLVTALDDCQNTLKQQGLDLELSDRYYSSLIRLPIFIDINSRFASQGLSDYGGLSWCLAQILERAIASFKSGDKRVSDMFIEYNEKIATVALLIGDSIPQLTLTRNDMDAINRSAQAALEWIELTSHEDEMLSA